MFETFKYPKSSKVGFPFEHLELYSKARRIDGKKINLEEKLKEIKNQPTLLFITRYPIYTLTFLKQWIRPFQEQYPDAQLLMLGIQEFNSYLSISPVLRWSVRRALSDREKESFYVLYDERKNILTRILFEKLNLSNKFGAYFFLLDSKGKISLRGVGSGGEKDIQLLNQAYQEEIQINKEN